MKKTIKELNGFESYLQERIIGQESAIAKAVDAFENGALGFSESGKPLASLLFLGPTGVGKTELTLHAGEFLFGKEKVFRFDMSEYMHEDAIKVLLGTSIEDPGKLGKILTEHKNGILLFDEIEKANDRIFDLFLQILGSGRITLSNHITYDLSGFFIVCTSNIGSDVLTDIRRPSEVRMQRAIFSRLGDFFRPELIGRFDEKIVFMPLLSDSLRKIARLNIDKVTNLYYQKHGYQFEVDDSGVEFLVRAGYNPRFGARPMKHAIVKYIANAVRHALRKHGIANGIITLAPDYSKLVLNPCKF
jgi:ATP-dependent Clp protease ATP-binding subunit ClpB